MALSHNNPFKLFLFFAFLLVVFSHICTGRYHGDHHHEPLRDNGPPRDHGPVLYTGEGLSKGDTLSYGNYTLEFKTDCTLVLSDNQEAVWASTNSPSDKPCKCIFWKGYLAILNENDEAVWEATDLSHFTFANHVLILQSNRDLVIYGPELGWTLPTGRVLDQMRMPAIMEDANDENFILYSGETLKSGESLKHGDYTLSMLSDCNLVFHHGDELLWSSESSGERRRYCFCQLQSDGNLVVSGIRNTDLHPTPFWAAFDYSHEEGKYALVLSSDGKCGIYGTAVWSSGTAVRPLTAFNTATTAQGIATVV